MPSSNTYPLTWVSLTLDVGYLFTAAPAKRSHCSLPWTRGISSGPPLLTLIGWDALRRSALAATHCTEAWLRGPTPHPRSGVATQSTRLHRRRSGGEELPHVRGQGQQPRWATPRPRSGAAARRSNPTSKELWLHGRRRAERSYSTFKTCGRTLESLRLVIRKPGFYRSK